MASPPDAPQTQSCARTHDGVHTGPARRPRPAVRRRKWGPRRVYDIHGRDHDFAHRAPPSLPTAVRPRIHAEVSSRHPAVALSSARVSIPDLCHSPRDYHRHSGGPNGSTAAVRSSRACQPRVVALLCFRDDTHAKDRAPEDAGRPRCEVRGLFRSSARGGAQFMIA